MTGSGKTGLYIGLIEEAALDGVPAIVIDPKGDLADLMLTFPELRPEDFRPWINEEDAARKGLTPDYFARQQVEAWAKGLADWGESGERIRRLREAADFATTATSLLALLGIDADPIQSREYVLLSTILNTAWQQGQNLDLATLIGQIQKPPVTRVGAMDLESFYPSKERFELAIRMNNLLAAPGFAAWMEGRPPRHRPSVAHAQGEAPGVDHVHRPPERRRAHVLRVAAPERGAGLDEVAAGHRIVAGADLHGRDLRLVPSGGRAALETTTADPTETGAGVRGGHPARDPEPRGPELQGLGQRRHVVHRPPADRQR